MRYKDIKNSFKLESWARFNIIEIELNESDPEIRHKQFEVDDLVIYKRNGLIQSYRLFGKNGISFGEMKLDFEESTKIIKGECN